MSMFEIGKRYARVAPVGDETVVTIKSEQDVAYHEDLAGKGFKYTEVKENTPPPNVCISCEG